MTRIPANPEQLIWARERARPDGLALAAWQSVCRGGNTRGGTP